MKRDLYTAIHKALRAQLCDALLAAGCVDARDDRQAGDVLARVRGAIELTRRHLHHENRHIHPLMEAVEPGSACASAREHTDHEAALERLEALARALERSRGPEREAAALALYRELALFAAEDFRHMHAEETANNAVLWRGCSDAQLEQAHAAIVASTEPALLRGLQPLAV